MNGCMETDRPLISIIVPVYKAEKYLVQCVNSLLNQTYKNLEIILIDDGSPDNSGKMCDAFERNDQRIYVIHQTNRGVSAARNAGIRVATGEYICFVDADDWAVPQYIMELWKLSKQYQADAVIAVETIILPIVLDAETALRELLYQKLYDTSPWGKLFRSSLIKQIFFPEGMFFEDLAVVCQMIGASRKVVLGRNNGYHYRMTPDGTMNGRDCTRLLDELKAADMMFKYIREMFPNLVLAAECRRFSAYFQVLMKLPCKEYLAEKEIIWRYICEQRGRIIKDSGARTKNRIAAAASYLGMNFVRFLWRFNR